jgi:hypothetical protein
MLELRNVSKFYAGIPGVDKVPFPCSYLRGKSNVQFIFWGFLVLVVPLAMCVGR